MYTQTLSADTQAIILLCGFLGQKNLQKPLSLVEYSQLVSWLKQVKLRPADLLDNHNAEAASLGSGLDLQRLQSLLSRGVQLGFSVEEWQRQGLWVISRSDSDYPQRYKQHLKSAAPPLLFGVGNKKLLTGGGLCIVGSRNVDDVGADFARKNAILCAKNHMPVVSGGARGVDQIAMQAALGAGGMVIGVLSDSLLKHSVAVGHRRAIADEQLILISAYHPQSRFKVWQAMDRNKLIYSMADFALVVSSDYKKGGTWEGACEELNREINKPVFVRISHDVPVGNTKLLEHGAISWPSEFNLEDNKLESCLAQAWSASKVEGKANIQASFDF